MKNKFTYQFLSIFVFFISISVDISAQVMQVDESLTPEEMVNLLVGNNNDITVSNVSYTGKNVASGSFSGGPGNIGIQEGIILTTGKATNAIGPNNAGNTGTNNGAAGDPDLNSITSGSFEACVLEFDFISTSTKVGFQYVFGSEEYPEFANGSYNDVFAFFVSGPGINGPYSNNSKNIALIPGTQTPVSINNINPDINQNYYVSNPSNAPFTQYDGFTIPLIAQINIQANHTYHMKLAISDIGDGNYDSGVFLAAGSFRSVGARIDVLPGPLCEVKLIKVDSSSLLGDGFLINFGDGSEGFLFQTFDQLPVINGFPQGVIPHEYEHGGTYTATIESFAFDSLNSANSISNIYDTTFTIPYPAYANFYTEPNPPCLNQPVQFHLTPDVDSSVFNMFFWNFDGEQNDGFYNPNSFALHPVWLYTSLDTNIARFIYFDTNQCYNIIDRTLLPDTLPSARGGVSGFLCKNAPVQFNDSSVSHSGVALKQWHWDFGDGNDSIVEYPNSPNIQHTYEDVGFYTIHLIIYTDNGCFDDTTFMIEILDTPTANFEFTEVCTTDTVQFTNSSTAVNSSNTLTYFWFFDDEGSSQNTSTLENPRHHFAHPGIYNVELSVYEADYCVGKVTESIQIFESPQVNFTHSISCVDHTTTFNIDTNLIDLLDIQEVFWDFGDNFTADFINPEHIYQDTGIYQVSLSITNQNGCSDSIVKSVRVLPIPFANFEHEDSVCQFEKVHFTDFSTSDLYPITTWHWDFGDGNDTTIQLHNNPNVEHIYTNNGLFQVQLTVETKNGCSKDTAMDVFILPQAVANFDFDSACNNKPIQFIDLSQTLGQSTIASWFWKFNDPYNGADTSTLQHPIYTYSHAGIYNVKLTVVNENGCESEITRQLNVKPSVEADFSVFYPCVGDTTYFSPYLQVSDSLINSYYWHFGDGSTTSDLKKPFHVYSDTGYYNITFAVENILGCTDTIRRQIHVFAEPVADFSVENLCAGQITQFTDQSLTFDEYEIDSWIWNFGDPSSSSNLSGLANPTHTYDEPGMYLVKLIITSYTGCKTCTKDTITIHPTPSANFSTQSVFCDENVYFTDESFGNGEDITAWTWTFGDGSQAINIYSPEDPDTEHIYPDFDEYEAILTVQNDGGCQSDTSFTVQKALCFQNALYYDSTLYCPGVPITFYDTTRYNQYFTAWHWDFGDGTQESYYENIDTITHSFQQAGTYQVSLVIEFEVSGDMKFDTVFTEVIIQIKPTAAFSFENTCLGKLAEFTDLSEHNGALLEQWQWTVMELDTNAYEQDFSFQFPEPLDYTVRLISTNMFLCSDTAIHDVRVYHPPFANFEIENIPCLGEPVYFTDASSPAESPIDEWQWNFGEDSITTDTSTLINPVYLYQKDGYHQVVLQITDTNKCIDTAMRFVEVYSLPTAEFNIIMDYLDKQGQFKFENISTDNPENVWLFDDGNYSIEESPVHLYTNDGTFEITLITTNDNGCTDTLIKPLEFLFKGLYVPNAFAPVENNNSDAAVFLPKGINMTTYRIEVFDSFGNLLWKSTALDENGSPAEAWDGTFKKEILPAGVYFWRAYAEFESGAQWKGQNEQINKNQGKELYKQGVVTLIK